MFSKAKASSSNLFGRASSVHAIAAECRRFPHPARPVESAGRPHDSGESRLQFSAPYLGRTRRHRARSSPAGFGPKPVIRVLRWASPTAHIFGVKESPRGTAVTSAFV